MSDYANWYAEIHPTESGLEVTRKIAKHLAVRVMTGNAIIVCDNPKVTLPVIRKRWKHILRLLDNQRAGTHGRFARAEIKEYSTALEATEFLVGAPDERVAATVWLTTPSDLDRIPKGVTSIYVASELTRSQLIYWTRQLKDEAVVLLFRKMPLPVAFGDGGADESE